MAQDNSEITTKTANPDNYIDPTKKYGALSKQVDRLAGKSQAPVNNDKTDVATPSEPAKPAVLDMQFIKHLKPEEVEELKKAPLDENFRVKHIQTYNDMKKYNVLHNELNNRVKELEAKGAPPEEVQELKDFVTGLKKDFRGTVERYKDKFGLPDPSFVAKQFEPGQDYQSRISQWQESELTPNIEKKHNLPEGTFVYDPADAYKAGTPSYNYRIATEKKQREYESEYEESQKKLTTAQAKIAEERNNQLLKLRKDFFPSPEVDEKMSDEDKQKVLAQIKTSDEEFTKMLGQLDNMFANFKDAERFTPDVNPLAIENIFKGVFFEPLTKRLVDDAVAKVHREYQTKGMYLADKSRQMPTDVSKQTSSSELPGYLSDDKRKFSPLKRSIYRNIQ